jgi:AAA+ ATPase superfamily predicted ATPase
LRKVDVMRKIKFIGRNNELKKLSSLDNRRAASLVTISGRRRIGKSRLAMEYANNKVFYRFSGLPPTSSVNSQAQRDEFSRQLSDQSGLPYLKTNDWSELFLLLSQKTNQKNVVVLLDEISWMAGSDRNFLGKLKNAWDLYFSYHPGLTLILCGSVSAWIEQNIISSTGFFGRISENIRLEELALPDSIDFLTMMGFNYSLSEKVMIVSILGGIPWYLEQIDPCLSALKNIQRLCFQKDSLLLEEYQHIFDDFFGKRSARFKLIIELLAKKTCTYAEIATGIDYQKGKSLSQYLNELALSGFIKKDYTWSIKSKQISRISHYRLSDNYLRFYFRYMENKSEQIKQGSYDDTSIDTLPGFESMLGLQFENVILSNRLLIHNALNLSAHEIVVSNPYFQRRNSKQEGCQVDYLIQTKFKTLYFCEIKFTRNKINKTVIAEMKEKLKKIKLPNGYSARTVLIHLGEVSSGVLDAEFFASIIDVEKLL